MAYTVPGIVAHESALRGGELLEIPGLGGATRLSASRYESKFASRYSANASSMLRVTLCRMNSRPPMP